MAVVDLSSAKTLRSLRRGVPPHKRVHIGGDNGYDVQVVILSADKCLEIEELTNEYCASRDKKSHDPNGKVNDNVRNQFYNALLVHESIRDPDDLSVRLSSSVQEVMECMDLEDINRVVKAYGELMMNKAPKLELLTEDQFQVVKKHLEVTPLSGLSTVSLVHLANFHQTIVSEK